MPIRPVAQSKRPQTPSFSLVHTLQNAHQTVLSSSHSRDASVQIAPSALVKNSVIRVTTPSPHSTRLSTTTTGKCRTRQARIQVSFVIALVVPIIVTLSRWALPSLATAPLPSAREAAPHHRLLAHRRHHSILRVRLTHPPSHPLPSNLR